MTSRSFFLVFLALCLFGCTRNDPNKKLASAETAFVIQSIDSPAGIDSREPDFSATNDGKILLSWVQKTGEKRYALRMAERDANGWQETRTVAEGENWFVNWADFPSVVALKDGSLAAHWLVKSASSTYAYDVNIARSKDGGKTWDAPVVPHNDNTPTEHGFVSLVPLADGRVGAIWLDGRNLKDVKDDEPHNALAESMTLRYAAIDANGKLSDEAELDDRVCECCQTSAAMTTNGIVAVYRDRSPTEIRDIGFVRNASDRTWSSPQPVHADNWQITACPVNGPAIAADGNRVAVAWYTEAGGAPHVNVAFSNDAGASFGEKIQVDDGESVGRVDVLLLPDGSAVVCWLSGTFEAGSLKVRRIKPDGTLAPPSVIAKTDIARSSGFPRMARLGNEVFFAWTEFGKPANVHVAKADISAYMK